MSNTTTFMRGLPSLTLKAEIYTPLVVKELQDIEDRLGGRSALVGMLILVPLTPDLKYVLGMLGDPLRQNDSLAEICAKGNLLPGDLLKQLAAAARVVGHIQSAQIVGAGIARVVQDLVTKAAPYEAACGACAGTGSLPPTPSAADPNPGPAPCLTCRSTGMLLYQPTLETQKLVVEMAQLLPKGGGINIGVQQNNQPAASGGSLFDRLQSLTDRVLYPDARSTPGDVVDAELSPPEV